ncbi:hypothetical protein IT570_07100 [Candidatus Sumerlaeota bacterium]|nr:hypothetical protein [Candidatus Sumerlaeota bacterium]
MNRQLCKIKLTAIEPLRVGGADNPLSDADNAVAILGGRPCIPGATLKGAYRAQLERFLFEGYCANGSWKDTLLKPCLPSAGKVSEQERQLAKRQYRKEKGCELRYADKDGICPACYLLGAMGIGGFVSVPFLFADPATQETLYSARIDRAAGTVAKGANRSYEVVPPGSVFEGELDVLLEDAFLGWELGKPRKLHESASADSWLAKLDPQLNRNEFFELFIQTRLQRIDRIGGYRSKGCGRVKIEVTGFKK